MPIRDRVAALLAELPAAPQYPSQGATLFIDLERREVRHAYTPLAVVKALLAGRGVEHVLPAPPAGRDAARRSIPTSR